MSKHFAVINLDYECMNSKTPITILNDLPAEIESERNAITNLIMTTYEHTDILSNIPTCQCGNIKSGFNLGKLCGECGTRVERPVENPIAANVWLRAPESVHGFINPIVWIILTKTLSSQGYNIMEWIINPSSNPPPNTSKVTLKKIDIFISNGWKRGLNNFIENFDLFLSILPMLDIKKREYELIDWLQQNRHSIFVKHIPFPTKSLLVVENNSMGSFAELPITGAIDAARTLVSISRDIGIYPQHYIEKRCASIIKNLSNYLWNTIKNSMNKKRGWIRGQLFRSRSHFCMRGVITTIAKPHHYEDVYIPWAQGLELLKIHIVSKLLKRGWNFTEAFSLVEANGNIYVPLLDEIMRELIDESPNKRIPISLQRNPTLTRASAQNLGIAGVKTDLLDQTISWAPICFSGPN